MPRIRGASTHPKKPSAASLRTLRGLATEKLRRQAFLQMCADAGLPEPMIDLRFWPGRLFRFDFSWPFLPDAYQVGWPRGVFPVQKMEGGVALESDGNGRHTRWGGFRRDQEKTNEAGIRGWLVLRVPSAQLCTPDTIALVKRALASRQ